MSDKPNIYDKIRAKARQDAENSKPPSLKDLQGRFGEGQELKELNRRFGINTEQPIETSSPKAA